MKRRTLLKAALPLAGLTGCTTGGNAGSADGGTATPTWTPTGVAPLGTPPVSVDPGDGVTEPFSLVDDPTADACFEPGRYAFAPEFVRVGPGGEATDTVAFRFAVELVA